MRSYLFLFLVAASLLSSCVSNKDGSKSFDPMEGAWRLDDTIGHTLKSMGYPATTRDDAPMTE
jgi:hypothetical protein